MRSALLLKRPPDPPPQKRRPRSSELQGQEKQRGRAEYTPDKPQQQDRDARLERLIRLATTALGVNFTPVRWRRLARLVAARSPAAIRRLEVERGLV